MNGLLTDCLFARIQCELTFSIIHRVIIGSAIASSLHDFDFSSRMFSSVPNRMHNHTGYICLVLSFCERAMSSLAVPSSLYAVTKTIILSKKLFNTMTNVGNMTLTMSKNHSGPGSWFARNWKSCDKKPFE